IDPGDGADAFDYSSSAGGRFDVSYPYVGSNPRADGLQLAVNKGNGAAFDFAKAQDNLNTFIASPKRDQVIFSFDFDQPRFRFYLGRGDDTFGPSSGSTAADLVDMGPGNDIVGFNYDSPIYSVISGSGDDTLDDDSGYPLKFVDAGSGHDIYVINADQPLLGAGRYEVTVPTGVEVFSVGAENDLVVHGNDLDNEITAGATNVTVYGNGGNDKITVQASGDVPAGDGKVLLSGGEGNDVLYAIASLGGTLSGGSGNDRIVGDSNSSLAPAAFDFQGGGGNDTADFSNRAENLSISLNNLADDGAAGEHSNVRSDIESVLGGGGADQIVGDPFNNLLKGNGGNDTIYGGAGNDTLVGGGGHDHLFGQDG